MVLLSTLIDDLQKFIAGNKQQQAPVPSQPYVSMSNLVLSPVTGNKNPVGAPSPHYTIGHYG